MTGVRTGLERLVAGRARGERALSGRIGLVTNPTGVLPDLTPSAPALLRAGFRVTALFSPEHGLRGTGQAGSGESGDDGAARAAADPATGLPVFDTYQRAGAALDELVASAGVDVLVFDTGDVGARFYTYVWTMHDLMGAAARLGLPFAVLDRPNPIGGAVCEGPPLDPAFASFVGRAPLPIRHGLTAGEIARFVDREIGAEPTVVPLHGWRREWYFDETGLPWVMPSVNMPTLDTALVYPGTGLFEGTNVSEGRGTTRPFELIGAPYLDGRFAEALDALGLPGVRFRDTWFAPVFGKHAGSPVRGVQLHVTDRTAFRPVFTAVSMLHVLRTLHPDDFTCEPFLDLLWGSGSLRLALTSGRDPRDLCGPPGRPGDHAELMYA
ncbi:exo-beta-N-acetylmuramidase NamZ family protein [Sphaerimonospora sp. CA-214678]|uniref:exo-beta-N-acetylmuramidase NamZ family protein n=1 Tax=Sphaerimonospora sp. CA-214678 TaxID=3240029 RepID=UPI003D8C83B4